MKELLGLSRYCTLTRPYVGNYSEFYSVSCSEHSAGTVQFLQYIPPGGSMSLMIFPVFSPTNAICIFTIVANRLRLQLCFMDMT